MEHVMELKGKYAKLRDDIREALLKGEVAEMVSGNDCGTCNFDSPTLYLPRWKKELVEQAAKEAGTHCWKLGYGFWKGFYLICPSTHSQGNPRTANAEAMHDHFNSLGYTSGVYYMMD